MNMVGNVGGAMAPIAIGYMLMWSHSNWNLTFYVSAAVYAMGILFWRFWTRSRPSRAASAATVRFVLQRFGPGMPAPTQRRCRGEACLGARQERNHAFSQRYFFAGWPVTSNSWGRRCPNQRASVGRCS